MAETLEKFTAAAQVACTIASLASGSARESDVIDNSSTKHLDKLIQLTFTLASGTPSTSVGPFVNLYVAAQEGSDLFPTANLNTGAPFQTGAGDASVGARGNPANLRPLGTFTILSNSSNAERSFRTQPFSVAAACGGIIPNKFSIIVENLTGLAFSSSGTSTSRNYLSQTGISTTTA